MFLSAINGSAADIEVDNATDLDSLDREFEFVEIGR
jgi:hypothetical protein